LVEQHLFGIRQIIIPIPWTHDQTFNAQYFVRQYDDYMVRQEGDHRNKEIEMILYTLISYRKSKPILTEIEKNIQQPLKEIIKAVLIL
jgi:hypothetical protein